MRFGASVLCASTLLLCTQAVAARSNATANDSSCGPNRPSPVVNCDKVDLGSCGGACCIVDVSLAGQPGVNTSARAYESFKKYLSAGGKDGSYTYVTGRIAWLLFI